MKESVLQLDIDFASRLRDEGIQRAADHADMEMPYWRQNAFEHLKDYLRRKPQGFEFMMEDFREYLRGRLKEPPHLRAFGAVAVMAAREGLIQRVGYRNTRTPSSHRTPATVWMKARS